MLRAAEAGSDDDDGEDRHDDDTTTTFLTTTTPSGMAPPPRSHASVAHRMVLRAEADDASTSPSHHLHPPLAPPPSTQQPRPTPASAVPPPPPPPAPAVQRAGRPAAAAAGAAACGADARDASDGAGAGGAAAGCARGAATAATGDAGRSADDGSDSDGDECGVEESTPTSSDDGSSEADDRYETVCVACHRHIAKEDPGYSCEVLGCRVTRCPRCTVDPSADFWCLRHGGGDASGAGATQSAAAASDGDTRGRCTIARLADVLDDAAAFGLEHAIAALSDCRDDPDMRDLLSDVKDAMEWAPAGTTQARGGALRRLREYLTVAPAPLLRAAATPATFDVLMAGYVTVRTRRSRRARRPPEWDGSTVKPTSVRNEVNAVVGLARVAGILRGDPKGSLPQMRRVMKACGCNAKSDASPRCYSFAWELAAAMRLGHVNGPTAFAVWALCVTATHLVLRPRYVRGLNGAELTHCGGDRYSLRYERGDKTNQPAMPPASSAGAGGQEDPTSQPPAVDGDVSDSDDTVPATDGLPTAHPRQTGAAGAVLHAALATWHDIRGPVDKDLPVFCRIETARTDKAPKGAQPARYGPEGTPCWVWPATQLSEKVIKREMVKFLTPIVGRSRALKRVLSGFRGGGEMELVQLRAPLEVRATIGWWRARRVAQEGAIINYEGCSMEDMWHWTRKLGAVYMQVLAPGVHRTTPPRFSRSIRRRHTFRMLAHSAAAVATAGAGASASAGAGAGSGGAAASAAADATGGDRRVPVSGTLRAAARARAMARPPQ